MNPNANELDGPGGYPVWPGERDYASCRGDVDRFDRHELRPMPTEGCRTNQEMYELLDAHRVQCWEIREREGCCGDGPDDQGRCYGCKGYCPRWSEATTAETFCRALIQWLEQIGTQDDEDSVDNGN